MHKFDFMKKLILLLAFLFLKQSSFAQDWAPFRLGETYNYVDSNSSFSNAPVTVVPSACNAPYPFAPSYIGIGANTSATNEIQVWIDSITTINGDSIFHFNKRVYRCDTCSIPSILANQSLDLGIIDESFTKNSNDQYIFNYQGDSLIISPYLSLNDSIISDSSAQIYSKVVQENYNFLTNYISHPTGLDSAKIFNYYENGNLIYQLVITKNLGLYSFIDFSINAPEIEQVGLESKELGVVQLTVKRIFNYDVGDEFSYQFVNWWNGEIYHSLYNIKILSYLGVSNDSTIYEAERVGWWTTNCCPGGSGSFIDTVELIITQTHNYGQYEVYYWMTEFERLNLRDNEFSDYYYNIGIPDLTLLPKNFLKDSLQEYKLISYSYGLESSFPSYSSNIDNPSFYIDSFSNIYNIQTFYEIQELYGKGIGLIQRYETAFEGWTCLSLLGYHKGNNTVGTILTKGLLLEQEKVQKENEFSINIYPNPSFETININFDTKTYNGAVQINIIDLQGNFLISKEIAHRNNCQLSTEILSSGIYILQVKNDKGEILGSKKIVVNK